MQSDRQGRIGGRDGADEQGLRLLRPVLLLIRAVALWFGRSPMPGCNPRAWVLAGPPPLVNRAFKSQARGHMTPEGPIAAALV
jgi:hypothetical protein